LIGPTQPSLFNELNKFALPLRMKVITYMWIEIQEMLFSVFTLFALVDKKIVAMTTIFDGL
jgi:hypothetical protein